MKTIRLLFVPVCILLLSACSVRALPPAPTHPGGPWFAPTTDSPAYQTHGEDCTGTWAAGNITDLTGQPAQFMLVRLSGFYGIEDALSGSATEYGAAGYELQIAAEMLNTVGALIQVWDVNANQPVSDYFGFKTFANCEFNLVIVNWEQVR